MNQSGVIPIIFANVLLYIPVLLANIIALDRASGTFANNHITPTSLLLRRLLRRA